MTRTRNGYQDRSLISAPTLWVSKTARRRRRRRRGRATGCEYATVFATQNGLRCHRVLRKTANLRDVRDIVIEPGTRIAMRATIPRRNLRDRGSGSELRRATLPRDLDGKRVCQRRTLHSSSFSSASLSEHSEKMPGLAQLPVKRCPRVKITRRFSTLADRHTPCGSVSRRSEIRIPHPQRESQSHPPVIRTVDSRSRYALVVSGPVSSNG